MRDQLDAVLSGESRWAVLNGDNATYLDGLPRDAALVSDPPYGMAWDTNNDRFIDARAPHYVGREYAPIHGDREPFDPTPWIAFGKVVLWGSNHYAQRLPVGTTLVWVKRSPVGYGSFLSDAEVAWQKGGYGVYCHTIIRASSQERGEHPTQKPVALMTWCIERLNLPPDSLIIDPYCGSGTTGVAAVQLGHRFIGIEREESYCTIARRRITDAAAQGSLFDA
jgi:site-specific DNA-methyltransferase (adenine-specific)